MNWALLASLLLLGAQANAQDGAKLMESKGCVACHGKDGNGAVLADGKTDPQYPVLAGQYASYLEHALQGYRSGERNNSVMAQYAKELSDADIKTISAYLATQKSKLHDLKGMD